MIHTLGSVDGATANSAPIFLLFFVFDSVHGLVCVRGIIHYLYGLCIPTHAVTDVRAYVSVETTNERNSQRMCARLSKHKFADVRLQRVGWMRSMARHRGIVSLALQVSRVSRLSRATWFANENLNPNSIHRIH